MSTDEVIEKVVMELVAECCDTDYLLIQLKAMSVASDRLEREGLTHFRLADHMTEEDWLKGIRVWLDEDQPEDIPDLAVKLIYETGLKPHLEAEAQVRAICKTIVGGMFRV